MCHLRGWSHPPLITPPPPPPLWWAPFLPHFFSPLLSHMTDHESRVCYGNHRPEVWEYTEGLCSVLVTSGSCDLIRYLGDELVLVLVSSIPWWLLITKVSQCELLPTPLLDKSVSVWALLGETNGGNCHWVCSDMVKQINVLSSQMGEDVGWAALSHENYQILRLLYSWGEN